VNEILRYNSVLDRVKVIYHLLRCVNYASLYSNLELIEVIYKALTLQPIYRLTKTFQLVQQNHPTEYDSYSQLTHPYCKPLREMTPHCHPPAIPCIAHYANVMQRCANAPKYVEIETGEGAGRVKHLVLRYLTTPIRYQMAIERFQSTPYLFQFHEKIQREVINCRLFTSSFDERSYERSYLLQPKAPTSS
jgi:hypothetical protein